MKRDIEKVVESVGEQIKSNNNNNDDKNVTSDKNDVENDNIIKNVVSESDMLKIVSEIVSESERVIGCNGVVISVDELEKEWQERLDEYVGQRVNFPHIDDEARCSQMLLLRGKSPLLLKDMRSLSYSPSFYELVPSVWDGVESGRWCYGERDLDRELCIDRETELYKLKRNYN